MSKNESARCLAKKAFEAERARVRAAVVHGLKQAGFVVRQQVYACGHTVDIEVMLQGGKSFLVQVGWQKDSDESYIFDKDFLALMEDKYPSTPLYFAVGVGKDSPVMRLDEALLEKLKGLSPDGCSEFEKLGCFSSSRA